MDYEKQSQAFEKDMMKNPWKLSRTAQVLWYRLNSLLKEKGKKQFVSIRNCQLARLMGATEKTFLPARSELENHGYLSCERGVKASPSRYFIKQLY